MRRSDTEQVKGRQSFSDFETLVLMQ